MRGVAGDAGRVIAHHVRDGVDPHVDLFLGPLHSRRAGSRAPPPYLTNCLCADAELLRDCLACVIVPSRRRPLSCGRSLQISRARVEASCRGWCQGVPSETLRRDWPSEGSGFDILLNLPSEVLSDGAGLLCPASPHDASPSPSGVPGICTRDFRKFSSGSCIPRASHHLLSGDARTRGVISIRKKNV